MAKPKQPTTGKQSMVDVAHPGQSPPPANSKSVIVGSGPLLKDPMMVEDPPVPAETEEKLTVHRSETAIKPPETPPAKPPEESKGSGSDTEADEIAKPAEKPKPDDTEVTKQAEQSAPDDTKKTKAPAPDDAKPSQQPKTQPKTEESEPETKESPETEEAEAAEAAPAPEELEAKAAEQAKHAAAVEKLADSKRYYLPIDTVEKRRSRRFVALGILLSVLLILAWADIALDAGLIQIDNIKPVTHFFSN